MLSIRRWILTIGLSGFAALLLVSCGGGGDASGKPAPSNEIVIDGSSTVYPISQAMAEEFSAVEPGVQVNVAFSGTGGGFERFCRGEIQISDASRPIKPDEVQVCLNNGITDVLELQVAIDALTIAVHPENTFVECLTVQQLHDIFRSGGATKWSDIDPSWPSENIKLYYPGTDSGTFDYMTEAIVLRLDPNATHRGDGTASEDDNILVQGIEADRNAIGYFGFAYYENAGQKLRAVPVDGGFGCFEPTFDNAVAGKYAPLSRPLYIYTRKSFLEASAENPVLRFVDFYLETAAQIVPEVGYITMADQQLALEQAKLDEYLSTAP